MSCPNCGDDVVTEDGTCLRCGTGFQIGPWKESGSENLLDLSKLFAEWQEKVSFLSSAEQAIRTAEGEKLLSMGLCVVSHVFVTGRKLNAHTMYLLARIVGSSPVPAEDAGNITRMAEHWRAWARQHGHHA